MEAVPVEEEVSGQYNSGAAVSNRSHQPLGTTRPMPLPIYLLI